MDYLSMMFGGGGGWLNAALLIGLFWAALAHPDRIRSVIEFRIATLLLGVSVVVPVIIQLLLMGSQANGPGMAMYATAISPILTMLAVICGVDSVTPRDQGNNG
jgi:hypothetical protein